MAHSGDRVCTDSELSDILSKLWELDDNKCYPGVEYEINLQGFVTSTRDTSRDFAHKNLFEWVDEEKLFDRETYRRSDRRVQGDAEEGVGQSPDQHILPHLLLPKCAQGHSSRIPDAFHALLDNYEMDVMEDEEVTWEERKENWDFLRAIMKTEVMKEAHAFLISKGQAPSEEDDFTRMLHDIWFRLFRRKGEAKTPAALNTYLLGRGEVMSSLDCTTGFSFTFRRKLAILTTMDFSAVRLFVMMRSSG
ncbi:poly(U)-specific endoribonuclease-A-like isoform X5 [Babylonia areolata]|uniref:poly(U)-specific endoribonuclease-A-like isoform X5 n=1 Tax=Babylonia areolata TaxID=304850 RepID=UPI003FD05C7C